MKNLVQVLRIETAFEKGQINNETRIAHHKLNDEFNPLS